MLLNNWLTNMLNFSASASADATMEEETENIANYNYLELSYDD